MYGLSAERMSGHLICGFDSFHAHEGFFRKSKGGVSGSLLLEEAH